MVWKWLDEPVCLFLCLSLPYFTKITEILLPMCDSTIFSQLSKSEHYILHCRMLSNAPLGANKTLISGPVSHFLYKPIGE